MDDAQYCGRRWASQFNFHQSERGSDQKRRESQRGLGGTSRTARRPAARYSPATAAPPSPPWPPRPVESKATPGMTWCCHIQPSDRIPSSHSRANRTLKCVAVEFTRGCSLLGRRSSYTPRSILCTCSECFQVQAVTASACKRAYRRARAHAILHAPFAHLT